MLSCLFLDLCFTELFYCSYQFCFLPTSCLSPFFLKSTELLYFPSEKETYWEFRNFFQSEFVSSNNFPEKKKIVCLEWKVRRKLPGFWFLTALGIWNYFRKFLQVESPILFSIQVENLPCLQTEKKKSKLNFFDNFFLKVMSWQSCCK